MRGFFIEIEEKIKTKEDLIFYLEEIDLAGELILKNIKSSTAEKMQEKISQDLVDLLIKVEEKEKIKDLNQLAFFLRLLKKHLLSLPQIKMEIAFRPNEKTVFKISRWLEEELGKKIILDLNVNYSIVAGAIIEYEGRRVDFSLAKEIKKTKILEKIEL